jgi:hypothetical protein
MYLYPSEVCEHMRAFYDSLSEKDRRRYAAIEAEKLGRGGVEYIGQRGTSFFVFGLKQRNTRPDTEGPEGPEGPAVLATRSFMLAGNADQRCNSEDARCLPPGVSRWRATKGIAYKRESPADKRRASRKCASRCFVAFARE